MIQQRAIKLSGATNNTLVLAAAIMLICVTMTMSMDLLEATVHSSSFYLSESLIFSSFWLIFLPMLFVLQFFTSVGNLMTTRLLLSFSAVIIHLLIYPAIVWLISKLFYDHTFGYWQTFNYGLFEYGFIVLIVYIASPILVSPLKKELMSDQKHDNFSKNEFVTSLLIASGTKRLVVDTKDINFFSATPPYITVHCHNKSFLHNETLRSIASKLNNELFVRVHKSTIVNMAKVKSMKSRMNGDYDLTLSDGTELRLSRNYAPAFKKMLEKSISLQQNSIL